MTKVKSCNISKWVLSKWVRTYGGISADCSDLCKWICRLEFQQQKTSSTPTAWETIFDLADLSHLGTSCSGPSFFFFAVVAFTQKDVQCERVHECSITEDNRD